MAFPMNKITRFAKLLLGDDMSGSGKGVCTALAISNICGLEYCTHRTQLLMSINGIGCLIWGGEFATNSEVQNQGECEDGCSRNCSCNTYAYVSGIGCLIWPYGVVI